MSVYTALEGVDDRWWSQNPERQVFVVTEISRDENKMLAVTFSTKYGIERTHLVWRARRFIVAVQKEKA
ncbi:hypothetical protein FDW83_01475 [Pseudarthrobacter sp. NamE2]|uniref:hypothetical protein n=1 Tax=Pseudarthrobacter sp. NamE2 TaxID=2576838 RepID=UPI0010FF14D4|nr:hypothetical protein [Pseudarthrobacter sp. NamE2]TLM86452.1 hypothetical protein FDW83_01475 [Pseudarthrobacter sp. NamE2]